MESFRRIMVVASLGRWSAEVWAELPVFIHNTAGAGSSRLSSARRYFGSVLATVATPLRRHGGAKTDGDPRNRAAFGLHLCEDFARKKARIDLNETTNYEN